jgi:hypothetical protein
MVDIKEFVEKNYRIVNIDGSFSPIQLKDYMKEFLEVEPKHLLHIRNSPRRIDPVKYITETLKAFEEFKRTLC